MASSFQLSVAPILACAGCLLGAYALAEEHAPPQRSLTPDAAQEDLLAGKTFAWSLAGKAAEAGQCREEWRFSADGILTVVSVEEIVTKTYRLKDDPNDSMMLLATTRLTTNGKPDCMGAVSSEVGQTGEVYLQFLNDGSFFTCGSTDGLSCYGVATVQGSAKP
jgi:hypothetical protein